MHATATKDPREMDLFLALVDAEAWLGGFTRFLRIEGGRAREPEGRYDEHKGEVEQKPQDKPTPKPTTRVADFRKQRLDTVCPECGNVVALFKFKGTIEGTCRKCGWPNAGVPH